MLTQLMARPERSFPMCRKLLLAATALTLLAAPAAHAQLFRGKAKPEAQTPPPAAAPAAGPAATPAAPARPAKASAAERALADRAEPLGRATFWSQQVLADPVDAEAGIKYAQALRAIGRHGEAAEAAEAVILYAPGNIDAFLEVGRARISQGQAFYGIDFLRQAQGLNPRDWRAASLLGVAYEQVSRPDDALAAYEQALKLSPDNPSVLSNIAMFHAARGEAPKAETLLRRAAAQPLATKEVRLNLAMVLGVQGKLTEAERLLRQELPPELANNNLAYLQAFHAAPAQGAPARTWESLRNGG